MLYSKGDWLIKFKMVVLFWISKVTGHALSVTPEHTHFNMASDGGLVSCSTLALWEGSTAYSYSMSLL